jgi:hypothetical protein
VWRSRTPMRLRECAPNLFCLERTKPNVTLFAYVAAKRFEVRNALFVRKLFPIRMCSGCGKLFKNFVNFSSFALNSNYVLHNSIEIRFSR